MLREDFEKLYLNKEATFELLDKFHNMLMTYEDAVPKLIDAIENQKQQIELYQKMMEKYQEYMSYIKKNNNEIREILEQ